MFVNLFPKCILQTFNKCSVFLLSKIKQLYFCLLHNKYQTHQLKDRFQEMEYKHNVVYYFDDMIGTFHYSYGHPMKPLRVAMTDEIVRKYKLDNHFTTIDYEFAELYNLNANQQTLTRFHSDEYIDVLKNVTPENKSNYEDQLYRFNFKQDCPVMERLYDYCISYTTGSVACSSILAEGKVQYAVNWSGGLHHAKQSEASGFCYVNDCVLAILQLLKTYQRVLYIDIDIHHGDGVEEAFYLTDRVMTCSFHKFKDYFPGTGHIEDIGKQQGAYRSVNFPLDEGMDDQSFIAITRPVLAKIMENFRPQAVVLQGGTDSLSGDRLGCFNLSVKGHGSVAQYMKTFNVPILMIGGGGYTLRNVPRCWTYQTSIITGVDIPDQIPENDYKIYFAPEYKIHMPVSNMQNQNSKNYLNKTLIQILQNLENVSPATVQMNINGGQPIKINVTQTMRERRDLWQNANQQKNTDKAD